MSSSVGSYHQQQQANHAHDLVYSNVVAVLQMCSSLLASFLEIILQDLIHIVPFDVGTQVIVSPTSVGAMSSNGAIFAPSSLLFNISIVISSAYGICHKHKTKHTHNKYEVSFVAFHINPVSLLSFLVHRGAFASSLALSC